MGGVVATVGELGWFEEMAARRGLVLDAPMHPTTRAYCDFLPALTCSGYPAQITAIWEAGWQRTGPSGEVL